MSSVLTVIERDAEGLTRASAAALTFARSLADASGHELHATIVGDADGGMAEAVGAHGAQTLHTLVADELTDYAPAAWAAGIADLREHIGAGAIVGAGDDRGAEVMAHVAAHADLPLAANCTHATAVEAGWELTRLRWGGVLLEDAILAADVGLFTVAPHQVPASPAASPVETEVRTHTPQVDATTLAGRVVETATLSEGVSLATASVVISGGRGVGSAEGFGVLEELAGLLGGAVGCSRVATNNGWRSHNDQVGQTGTRVAPDLYVACGISGATQHWVGCMASKRILAINTDAEAPMVTRADYAVLGDLHELLPAIVAEVQARKGA